MSGGRVNLTVPAIAIKSAKSAEPLDYAEAGYLYGGGMSQDFGEGRHVVGRKKHRCEACLGPIPKGETHFHYKGIYDGDWQNWRMHEECFEAWDADGSEEFMPGDAPIPDRVRELMAQ